MSRRASAAGSHRGRALRNVLVVKLWLGGTVTLLAILTGPTFPVGARDAMVAFAVGALCGALLALHVGTAAALLFGLAIIIGVTIAAHVVSRPDSEWSAS